MVHKFLGSGLAQIWPSLFWRAVRHDSPNSASAAALQIELLLDVVRQRQRRFDHFAVEITNVDRTVGADCQIDRAKPVVGGSKEFAVGIDSLGDESRTLGFEGIAVNQIIGGVADERLAMRFFWEKPSGVDQWAATRSDEP